MNPPPSTPATQEDRHDVELVLASGGASAFALGVVVVFSTRTAALSLPLVETYALILFTGLVSGLGWLGVRAGWPPRPLAWAALMAYTLLITFAIHYAGGPQTALPGFYLLVVVAASFVLGPRAAYFLAGASLVCYGGLLLLEFAGALPILPIWGQAIDPRAQKSLLLVNWLTVAAPVLLTAYLGGSLAQRLKARNQQLRETEAMRQDLVEMLVHDLRNPLTVLLGVLDLLNRVASALMTESQRQLLHNARRSGHLMLVLVGDILDVAKLEAGQLQLKRQSLDIRDLLSESAEQARALAELEELSLTVEAAESLPPIYADKQLIQRVIDNLVSNAIKHTPHGGSVTLSSQLLPQRHLTVSVSDTGAGIPPEQHHRIFEKFGQVEQTGVQRHGTGLGLTFCKLAVEAHGGRIWVESAPGQGSTFTFSLPVAESLNR
jgi:signal transduction histidine kinase